MDPKRRMIPSRQTLRRVNGRAPSDLDVAGVDLILHLMSAVEVIRNSVYTRLHKEAGLSEGKFSLMMSLRDAGHPVSTGRLAAHLGVSDATVSVMVKRMLAEETPLIARYADPDDRRAVLVGLTKAGEALLDRHLPDHFARIAEFSAPLNAEEREQLVALIKKLLGPDPAADELGDLAASAASVKNAPGEKEPPGR